MIQDLFYGMNTYLLLLLVLRKSLSLDSLHEMISTVEKGREVYVTWTCETGLPSRPHLWTGFDPVNKREDP